jgi:pyruvate dehydrogenase E2 component (dihydrolipoamide acetyltransferase)
MPRLSDSMEEGTILKWLVSEGDEVERGQEIVEIETDKANMTYEADTSGTVLELIASEGDTIALGEPIARIGEAGEGSSDGGGSGEEGRGKADEAEDADDADESGDEDEPEAESTDEEKEEQPKKQEQQASQNGSGDGERVKASPVARRMAGEMGVDLGSIEGSGPGGRIVKADVEAAAESGGAKDEEPSDDGKPTEAEAEADEKEEAEAEVPEPNQPEPAGDAGPKGEMRAQELTRLQRTVSRRMAESKATAPDFALHVDIDMTAAVDLREQLKQMTEKAPSFNDMIVRACAMALREHPRVNGAYRDGKFELYSRINVGVAVAAQDALVVPTVFDADKKSLGEISRSVRELATKVRDGKITPPELSGGTFTVSNLGMYGIDSFTAIINTPQAALLAVGALKKKPIVTEDGQVEARDMIAVNLVCDHRILYGADGAQFLGRVRELLEQPLALAL